MSELSKKLQTSFEKSSKQLETLNEDLNKIADLQSELSKLEGLTGAVQLAVNNLRKLSKDHADYLQKVNDLNDTLSAIAKTLIQIEPDKFEERLSSIESQSQSIKEDILKGIKGIKSLILQVSLTFLVVGAGLAYWLVA